MRSRALVLSAALAFGLAACSGGSDATTATDDTGDTAAAASGEVTFVGTEAVQWAETEKAATAGEVELTLVCEGAVPHNLVIDGVEGDAVLAECSGNDEATATVTLEAGTYEFHCTIPGHHEAGMVGELTVA